MSSSLGEGEGPFDSYQESRMKQTLRRIILKIDRESHKFGPVTHNFALEIRRLAQEGLP